MPSSNVCQFQLPLAKEIRDGVTWQQMKLFIVLPEEETGFYLMRLDVVLHLADCDHVRSNVCSRLTKWFVASVNKYCYSVSTAQFPIFGSSCLPHQLSKYLYSEIFQTANGYWKEGRFQQGQPWKGNLWCIVIQNRIIFSINMNEFSDFRYCNDSALHWHLQLL